MATDEQAKSYAEFDAAVAQRVEARRLRIASEVADAYATGRWCNYPVPLAKTNVAAILRECGLNITSICGRRCGWQYRFRASKNRQETFDEIRVRLASDVRQMWQEYISERGIPLPQLTNVTVTFRTCQSHKWLWQAQATLFA